MYQTSEITAIYNKHKLLEMINKELENFRKVSNLDNDFKHMFITSIVSSIKICIINFNKHDVNNQITLHELQILLKKIKALTK